MTILDEFQQDDRRVLDRLVDGELSEAERRELLAALDDEPGGWRRCALAFLEAQTWRWQLSRMAAEPIVAQLSTPAKTTPTGRWQNVLSIAAGLLLAFGLGTLVPRAGGDLQVADRRATDSPLAATGSESDVPMPAVQDPPRDGRWQMLTLKPVGDGTADPIQVRVVDEALDDPSKLLAERTPLTATLAQGLEQAGWQVDRHQRLQPYELTDGRQVVVPVEELELRAPSVVPF